MKAVLLNEFGGVDKLEYTDFPTPQINPNEILIKVAGVALNHLDLFVRKGIPGLILEMPHILGSDISGSITEVGSRVNIPSLDIGQSVVVDPGVSCGVCEFCNMGEISLCKQYKIIGEHVRGGYAEYIAIPAENAVLLPDYNPLSLVDSAAVPLTFMTAYRMLITRAHIKMGEDVLLTGIGGGVALAAMQIAKLNGARTFATSSSNEKLELAKSLGADFTFNYNENPDYHKDIYKITNKRGVDIVGDSAGQATWERSIRVLRKGGRLVTCGATTGPIAKTNINLLFWNQLDLLGSTMGTRSELREVLNLVWKGKLKPVVDRILPLSDVQKAHVLLEEGKQFGKIILQI
jgi:NADPH2:quinone reductase